MQLNKSVLFITILCTMTSSPPSGFAKSREIVSKTVASSAASPSTSVSDEASRARQPTSDGSGGGAPSSALGLPLRCGSSMKELGQNLKSLDDRIAEWAKVQPASMFESPDLWSTPDGRSVVLFAAYLLPKPFPFKYGILQCWKDYVNFEASLATGNNASANALLTKWDTCLQLLRPDGMPPEAQGLIRCFHNHN